MNDLAPIDSPLAELISDTFVDARILNVVDIGRDRSLFSRVVRVELAGGPHQSVVVKAPAKGPNGLAARSSGAYAREAFAYQELLTSDISIDTARCYRVGYINDDPWFVLQDLTSERHLDQILGLGPQDTLAITKTLAALHDITLPSRHRERLGNTGPQAFDETQLHAGLDLIRAEGQITDALTAMFERLLGSRELLLDQYGQQRSFSLCHGDPRADNVIMVKDHPVLLDWQQVSSGFGEADVSWLLGTSLDTEQRRLIEADVVGAYATQRGLNLDESWTRYRLGYLRPGLAVLMLAQRTTTEHRTKKLVQISLQRIAQALGDLEVSALQA